MKFRILWPYGRCLYVPMNSRNVHSLQQEDSKKTARKQQEAIQFTSTQTTQSRTSRLWLAGSVCRYVVWVGVGVGGLPFRQM